MNEKHGVTGDEIDQAHEAVKGRQIVALPSVVQAQRTCGCKRPRPRVEEDEYSVQTWTCINKQCGRFMFQRQSGGMGYDNPIRQP